MINTYNMKKLRILAVVLTGLLIPGSCSLITTDFDTNLRITILADVEKPPEKKSGLKDAATYPFSATEVLDIKDNSKINDYIDRLKEIEVQSIKCTFSGIPAGETITEFNISFSPVGINITLENITSGASVTLDVSPQLLDNISKQLTDNQPITINISGQSTYAPMVLSTLIDIPVAVTARVLD